MANELDNLLSHEAMQRNREGSIEPQGWNPRDPLGSGPFWNAPTSVKAGGSAAASNIEELLSIITNPQALLDIGGAVMASKVMGESPMGILEAFTKHSPESVQQTRAANEARAEGEGLNWMGQLLSEGAADAALGGFAGLARQLARRAGRSGATQAMPEFSTEELEALRRYEDHVAGPPSDLDIENRGIAAAEYPEEAAEEAYHQSLPADSPDEYSLPVDSPEAQQRMDEDWQAANPLDDPDDPAVYDLQGRRIRTTSMDVFDTAEGDEYARLRTQGGWGGGPDRGDMGADWDGGAGAEIIPTGTDADPLTVENRLRNVVEDTLDAPGVRGDADEARGWHRGTELEDKTTREINALMDTFVPRDPSGKRPK